MPGKTPLMRRVTSYLQKSESNSTEALPLHRREFITGTVGAGLALTGLSTFPRNLFGAPSAGPVAVLGGGIAGLTVAYQLSKRNQSSHVFEGSSYIGGRIRTQYQFNSDNMFCELGAVFVDTNHIALKKLCQEVGVGIEALRSGKAQDLFFYNGKMYSEQKILPLFKPFAKHLAADARGLLDKGENYTPKAVQWDKTSLKAYLDSKRKDVDDLVLEIIENAYRQEFGLEAEEQNALNLIWFMSPDTSQGLKLYGDSNEGARISGGSYALVEALLKKLPASKVTLSKQHKLIAISEKNQKIVLTFDTNGKTREFKYDRVICTLPFSTLRKVDGIGKLVSKTKQRCIRELGYGMHVKPCFGFKDRFWKQKYPKWNGTLRTALPTGPYWEESVGQKGTQGILANFLAGNAAHKQATLRKQSIEDLKKVFGGIEKSYSGKSAMFNWPEYEFSRGSYACPKVGQYTTIRDNAGVSEMKGRLLFCGEHTSDEFEGYMNGSIETANRAVAELLSS